MITSSASTGKRPSAQSNDLWRSKSSEEVSVARLQIEQDVQRVGASSTASMLGNDISQDIDSVFVVQMAKKLQKEKPCGHEVACTPCNSPPIHIEYILRCILHSCWTTHKVERYRHSRRLPLNMNVTTSLIYHSAARGELLSPTFVDFHKFALKALNQIPVVRWVPGSGPVAQPILICCPKLKSAGPLPKMGWRKPQHSNRLSRPSGCGRHGNCAYFFGPVGLRGWGVAAFWEILSEPKFAQIRRVE
jgi:hypothetical protein